MKEIMAKESSSFNQGVASFEYSPATERQPVLFEYTRPLEDLGQMLLTEYSKQTLLMKQIFERHNVGRPFVSKNYKDVLLSLERDGKILAEPPMNKRRRDTFGDDVSVTFP